MAKKSKKVRKQSKNVVSSLPRPSMGPTLCGFPLVKANVNRLWRWDDLTEV